MVVDFLTPPAQPIAGNNMLPGLVRRCGKEWLRAVPQKRLLSSSFSSSSSSRSEEQAGKSSAFEGFALYTWGKGDSGQLGHRYESQGGMLASNHELLPRPVERFADGGVRGGSFGQNHSAVVTMGGELWTWGNGANGRLGHGDTSGCDEPKLVEALKGKDIVQVSCGGRHTLALDGDGHVYSFGFCGASSFFSELGGLGLDAKGDVTTPTRIEEVPEGKVIKIGAGERHSAMLTDDGEVWLCGDGEYGMMGNGSTGDQLVPEPVDPFLDDMFIKDVAVGHTFTLALTDEGRVYGWGRNDCGQLGIGGGLTMDVYAMEEFPRLIEAFGDTKIASVHAGHTHAAALTEDGKCFVWGMKRSLEPELITVLEDIQCVDVSCGDKFTAIVGADGSLWTFGRGGSHCLGHNNKKTLNQPAFVEVLARLHVAGVTCGFNHIGALVDLSRRDD